MAVDFSGWVTKYGVRCSDGRTILRDAFAHCDNVTVPVVWNHQHNSVDNVLGHARLEKRNEGIYGYATFNDTESGRTAKELVQHGDVNAMSIYANELKSNGAAVVHGTIREVSLVLSGANPGAHIEYVDMAHSESGIENSEAIIFGTNDDGNNIFLEHSDNESEEYDGNGFITALDLISHADKEANDKASEKTLGEIFDTLTEEQKTAVYAILGMVIDADNNNEDDENGGEDMKHNLFDSESMDNKTELMHAAEGVIIGDAKKFGSVRESFLAHAEEYGIDGVEWLFPEVHNLNPTPEFIKRDTTWVDAVYGGAHKIPWSRIKSVFADITEDEARAKGYIKGKYKKEEVFSLLRRTTQPTTIYKKQKMDRDDIVDMGNFDAMSWLKTEMRIMLNEEIARAILLGDGRLASSEDKIDENCIRPIWKDEDLFTVKAVIEVANTDDVAAKTKKIIDGVIRSRKKYKGSGNPALYTTEDFVTECLLLEDGIGHKLYKSEDELARTLRVSKIITVEVMEGLQREVGSKVHDLVGIIVNMNDYNLGADKGGSVNMFEDFDIDYNQQKYLIETRCSGSLVKPFSAISIETVEAAG